MPFFRISSHRGVAVTSIGMISTSICPSGQPAFPTRSSLTMSVVCVFAGAALVCGGRVALAADDAPPAGSDFQTQDISIGEPISLPSAPPLAPSVPPAATPPGGAFPLPPTQLPSVVVPDNRGPSTRNPATGIQPQTASGVPLPTEAAGSGWLGIAVDDTLVTGRLVVVEVAPDGPAAKAGIRPQDMLLAMNGNPLQTADELAATLAAIAPGQRVKMLIGRDNRVEDVAAQASTRPTEAVARDWQSSGLHTGAPPSAAAVPAPVPPPLAAPTQFVPAEQSFVSELPAPAALSVLAPPGILPAAAQPARAVAEATPRPSASSATLPGRTALGVRTVPVDPSVQSRFHLSDTHGAFVIGVVQDLPAAKAGVPPGSVIVAINNQPVRSPRDLTQLVSHGPVGTPVPIHFVLPGGQSKQADVVLQSLEQPLERALVGSGNGDQATEPPSLQPTAQPSPLTTRRVQPTAANRSAEADPLDRLEELLRLMNARLEQIERRLDRIETGRQ